MGQHRLLTAVDPSRSLRLPDTLRRRKPRSYLEWRTLRDWEHLPKWEENRPGYLLRYFREREGLTQADLASRLGCSQQAVAQAERWEANPSVRLMTDWARALGHRLDIRFCRL